jgi:hypothetical protein
VVALSGLAAGLAAPAVMRAQTLSVLEGKAYSSTFSEWSRAYKIEYRQVLDPTFSATFDYINEGHFTGHHRDGYGLQLWYKQPIVKLDRLSLSVGAGTYYLFDTITPPGGASSDFHHFAPLVTVTLRGKLWWKFDWVVSADAIVPSTDFKTDMISAGLDYKLGKVLPGEDPRGILEKSDEPTPDRRNELSVYGTLSVINISSNPKSYGVSAEYRHRFLRHFDGTLTYIYEGDPRVVRRSGLAAQVWPVRTDEFSGFEFGVGFGAYVFIDRKNQPIPGQATSASAAFLVSAMASHAITERWFGRFIWDRVVTNYSRDADIWRLGLGYKL